MMRVSSDNFPPLPLFCHRWPGPQTKCRDGHINSDPGSVGVIFVNRACIPSYSFLVCNIRVRPFGRTCVANFAQRSRHFQAVHFPACTCHFSTAATAFNKSAPVFMRHLMYAVDEIVLPPYLCRCA
ncbi:hypothetical protein SCLCIDRAFT_340663 [Scleroderma citrinum Foug A]|uniref:Uncharacterized protein n=1 Tax=Scleroderma citrinum Foug A TaxID=1036808 RepID=A0A0C3D1Z9_9AGAM|nr:hypothetical protein SCLCIDRAFT_340663 [Scleroderma citrinum Foug A]